jgi:Protein of unknown function (DUF4238)
LQVSVEGDHHYVPQFHLENWGKGRDRKFTQWGRIAYNGKLVHKDVAAAGTAYEPGLYSLEHVRPTEAQQIETKILHQIEDGAAPVLIKLVTDGPASLSAEDRFSWTRYLQASLLRVPHVVEKMKTEGRQLARNHLARDHAEFLAAKGAAPEKTLLEWAEKHAPARIANTGLRVMVRMLNNERAIERIIHLSWMVRDVSRSSRPLLIGDDPFEPIGDLYKPRCLISIPLTPTHVFFGTDASDVVAYISQMTDRAVVNASNVSTVSTAKRFAYGEAERTFIDRYLLR